MICSASGTDTKKAGTVYHTQRPLIAKPSVPQNEEKTLMQFEKLALQWYIPLQENIFNLWSKYDGGKQKLAKCKQK